MVREIEGKNYIQNSDSYFYIGLFFDNDNESKLSNQLI